MGAHARGLDVSVVVPVYNSETVLPLLVERLHSVLATLGGRFELVAVVDGSPDRSSAVLHDLARRHDWVRPIDLLRNYGQHNAILCGIRAARYPIVITMDDDLQHPPEEIPTLLKRLEEGFDVVYGTPARLQHGPLRDFASWFTKLMLHAVLGMDVARIVSAFRVLRTELRDAFEQFVGPAADIDVLLSWGTRRFGSVEVRHAPRADGKSNYTIRRLLRHAMTLMTAYSDLPLRLASYFGMLLALFGLGVLAWVLGRFLLHGSAVQGFTFLASIIAIFSGGQLLALGIMGEYLARMHFRLLDKPSYVIRRTPEFGGPDAGPPAAP